jgi:hypothetical protein
MPCSTALRLMMLELALPVTERADVVVDQQELVDARPAAVALVQALRASHGAEDRPAVRSSRLSPTSASSSSDGVYGHLALVAEPAHEPLREHRDERARDEERLDAHVGEPRERRRRVVRVDRREDEVAGERGLHRVVGRLLVADLADEDDVGVLAEVGAQRRGEGQIDLRVHLRLPDATELVLDRVLDREDVEIGELISRAPSRASSSFRIRSARRRG